MVNKLQLVTLSVVAFMTEETVRNYKRPCYSHSTFLSCVIFVTFQIDFQQKQLSSKMSNHFCLTFIAVVFMAPAVALVHSG